MEKLETFKSKMAEFMPDEWNRIPDINLYMDQVISYMERQHIGLGTDGGESLTSSMINNYIKHDLLPRAKGKRYDREHIAYLTAICLLKQVLTVNETGILLQNEMKSKDIESFYREYRDLISKTYRNTAESLDCSGTAEELADQALKSAVAGYAQILLCKKILEEIEEKDK